MLINLVAWIYISLICLIWGNTFLSAMGEITGFQKFQIDGGLICLAGLSVTGVLALCLSLLMPLDWKAHCIIVLPALYYCLKKKNRHAIRMQVSSLMGHFSRTGYCFLGACILMTLVISSYGIEHPDTLYYHARSVLLFERYAPIPGIANLRVELGFQSLWFASLAVFKLDTPALYNVIFLNGAVLCWYFIFIIGKIDKELLRKKEALPGTKTNGWAWLLLLAYSLVSWTQVRLTAASASPDFIITLYIWASIYTAFQMDDKNNTRDIYTPLLFLFCFTGLLIKLSAIMLLLLAFVAIARSFRIRPVRSTILYPLMAVIMLIPLLARNRIASGYLLYPSPFPDIFHEDWKTASSTVHLFERFISMYARFPVDMAQARLQWDKPFHQWIPAWWNHINLVDRLLITVIIMGIVAGILQGLRSKLLPVNRAKQTIPQTGKKTGMSYRAILLMVTLAGSLLWFLKAPDPRFGTGFLVPLSYFLYLGSPLPGIFAIKRGPIPLSRFISVFSLCKIASWSLLIAVAGYCGYRFINFFNAAELIRPAGIDRSAYEPLGCEDLKIDLLGNKIGLPSKRIDGRGINTQACKDDIYGGFRLRGQTVADGFKPLYVIKPMNPVNGANPANPINRVNPVKSAKAIN